MTIRSTIYINSCNEINIDKAIELDIFPCEIFCDGVKVENAISFNIVDGYVKTHLTRNDRLLIDSCSGDILIGYLLGSITYRKSETDLLTNSTEKGL